MSRVPVDFSTTVRGGLIRARLRRFPNSVAALGERVEAVDEAEGLAFFGVVEDLDDRFAYLRMEWEAATNRTTEMARVDASGRLLFHLNFVWPDCPVDSNVGGLTFAASGETRTLPMCAQLTA